MYKWRCLTKNILINHLNGAKVDRNVDKAIQNVAKVLEEQDLFLLSFMNLLLGLDKDKPYRPYILQRHYMVKLSMQTNLSLAGAYKVRERLLDMLAIALTALGVLQPFEIDNTITYHSNGLTRTDAQ